MCDIKVDEEGLALFCGRIFFVYFLDENARKA
jgi:hypothetical protein